jgi:RNA polymerase sigma factor (sigma-70 family)
MTVQIPVFSEDELKKFITEQWNKALAYIHNRYGLSEYDSRDVFADAFSILYKHNLEGKLSSNTLSTSTYLFSICKNKALEKLRDNKKYVYVDDMSLDHLNAEIRADKVDELLNLLDDNSSFIEKQEALVRKIVRNLPSPCNELLWGYFRDNLSMKTLAQMYDYKSENSVKVTKHRCQKKFKDRFNELKEILYDK